MLTVDQLSRDDAEYFLQDEKPGRYITRFSRSVLGGLVVSFVDENEKIRHCNLQIQTNGSVLYPVGIYTIST